MVVPVGYCCRTFVNPAGRFHYVKLLVASTMRDYGRFSYMRLVVISATLSLFQAFSFSGLCAPAYSPPSTISSSLVSLATPTLLSTSSFRPFMPLNFHALHQRSSPSVRVLLSTTSGMTSCSPSFELNCRFCHAFLQSL